VLLCLCAALLLPVISSCAGNSETGETSSVLSSEAFEAETAKEKTALEKLPDADYGGLEFRVSVTDKYSYEIFVDSENGDVCNDAVYRRNKAVEEKYNVKITALVSEMAQSDNHNIHSDFIKQSVLSGDDVFDLSASYVYRAGGLISEKMFLGYGDIPNIELSNPWWIQKANEAFNVHGEQYIAVSDLSITAVQLAYGVLFNKTIADNFNIPDLYAVVDDGEWTIERMIGLSKDVYSDLNGNGEHDVEDLYGYIGSNSTDIDLYPFAFGLSYTATSQNGDIELSVDHSKMATAIEKIYELYWGSEGTRVEGYYWDYYTRFRDGLALFIPCCLVTLYNQLRDMDADYGIIPPPKFNEEQPEYLTNSLDNYSALGVPVTAVNLEMIGSVLEALSAESMESVVPVFYETALQNKYSRDENSLRMLDVIMDGRTYDFSILYAYELNSLPYLVRTLINKKSVNWASSYQKIEGALTENLATLNNLYKELSVK